MTIRKPVQVVEIDIDQCTRVYGSAPCAAVLGTTGERKCFNTYRTCQDKANYNKGTLTLRFSTAQDGLPKDETIFPAMRAFVMGKSTVLNLGGVGQRTGPLGRRETLTLNFRDFKYGDQITDKYAAERVSGAAQASTVGYNPRELGTFFGKLMARSPYYIGREVRILDGFQGQALIAMAKRHYVITGWNGPDAAGNVSVEVKDVLDLADNKKALCPKPSQGKLDRDIAETGLPTFTLIPAGVGAEYPASGRGCIGSEIVTFTRSGDDITITARAVDGTTAATHSEDDTFQLCYRVEDVPISDVAHEILTDYADIAPSFIPLATWQNETTRWQAALRLTATIAKPTGVLTLMAELAAHGVYFWWDRTSQLIRMRANRPLDIGEAFTDIDDEKHVIQGTLEVDRRDDERLSQVMFAHGILDPTQDATSLENYRRAFLAVDLSAEGAQEYDQASYHTIYSRWLGNGNDVVASSVANRLLNRYRDPPVEVKFRADIGAKNDLDVADLVRMTTRVVQDETGASLPQQMQVIASSEIRSGAEIEVTAQVYDIQGRFGFITENGRSDYAASTDAQRAQGIYIAPNSGVFADGTEAYKIF